MGYGINTAIYQPAMPQDVIHMAFSQTPQERALQAGIHEGMEVNMNVRCAQPWSMQERGDGFAGITYQLPHIHNLPYTRIREAVCAEAVAVGDILAPVSDSELLDRSGLSLLIVAHETEHYKDNVSDEAQTTCLALRQTEKLARGLGASAAVANQLQEHIVDSIIPRLGEGVIPSDCKA